ncbi:hypothetical protein DID78_06120 [Candidatus Marinamargulisbacteria bacterium SCGC AG-343-D04]|nr:hypothetical protein DID78_06120 [Candidatus Marinamargulisbacteria bacterium SCGC AG-343-D04]
MEQKGVGSGKSQTTHAGRVSPANSAGSADSGILSDDYEVSGQDSCVAGDGSSSGRLDPEETFAAINGGEPTPLSSPNSSPKKTPADNSVPSEGVDLGVYFYGFEFPTGGI